ncbi:electron transport complex subunit RsxD [Halioxenophilus sp. WMMB6]|uniref:electron transport complex subunit RsxD n=1 Tax=Halioxenophilus sp. WMMB6 TaxID=3073815 RepID=UPI00295E8B48|nr:electron transport complex subunit RsxD [Halioxenophilus sp. WMMB6]
MSFIQHSSPHAHGSNSTQKVMLTVALATLPGLVAMVLFFGIGPLINVMLCVGFCVGFEALALALRKRPIGFYLRDYSALVTGVLLGLALPPYCPWWLLLVGAFFAIVVAKQLYGGLGFNPFNPAMVGYVVLLISFPVAMTQWAAPTGVGDHSLPGLAAALSQVFSGQGADGYSGATPLDAFKQAQGLTVDAIYEQPLFSAGHIAGAGWEWVNLGFLIGGLFLLWRGIFSWHAPAAMLLAISLLAFIFFDGSSESGGSPLLHLFSGATMLGAFFIVTDPVSSAVSKKGRLIYGAGIGALVYVIRTWGNYPDAVAFSVLLMNFAAPFIDYYTLPRTYGHTRPRRATEKADN